LLGWFSQNARDLPWRRTRDPYAIWVSEIMLQQTQVKTVLPYWERWMRELPTVQAAANASPDKIHKLWEGLGYYTRVRNLQKAAQQIVAQQNTKLKSSRRRGNESQTKGKSETPHVVSYKFPQNFDDILALPGIGRYTAGAICSIAFNQPTPILDGNVIRVLTRVFGIPKNPREKKTNAQLWRLAEELVIHVASSPFICRRRRKESHSISHSSQRLLTSSPTCSHLNQSLMELGALVCTPRQPQCRICPVKKLCVAFRENRTEELPNLGKRTTVTAKHFVALVVERNGRFLVRQRPAGVVNAHLWEFPNVEIGTRLSQPQDAVSEFSALRVTDPRSESVADVAAQLFGSSPTSINHLCTVKHSITRYRITLEAWRVSFGGASSARPKKSGTRRARPSENNGVWLTPAQLQPLAFASAHKKLVSATANCILSGR
jgi:A/G-specific adenine glycosylase